MPVPQILQDSGAIRRPSITVAKMAMTNALQAQPAMAASILSSYSMNRAGPRGMSVSDQNADWSTTTH
jgi:hypothetical protein